MPSIHDWREFQKFRDGSLEVRAARQQTRNEFQRAALDANQVTGIPEWDTFATYVNGLCQLYRQQNDQFRRALERPDADDNDVLRLNKLVVHNNIRIETLLQVIRFPAEVKERFAQLERETAATQETANAAG